MRLASRSTARRNRLHRMLLEFELLSVISFSLVQEPWVHRGHLRDLLDGVSLAQSVANVASRSGCGVTSRCVRILGSILSEPTFLPVSSDAHALHQRFFECAADRHHFADRFHLRAERVVGSGKFLELPLRNLDDDVIERRLKARRRFARDVVAEFRPACNRRRAWPRSSRSGILWPSTPAPTSATRADSSR